MQNKISVFATVDCSLREARLLRLGLLNSRLDQEYVPAKGSQRKEAIEQSPGDLKKQLENLKNLEWQKLKNKSQKELNEYEKTLEKLYGIEIVDGQVEGAVRKLIEAWDKEVGTAVQVEEGHFKLVHASESAVKLVLAQQKIAGNKIDSESLVKICVEAGFDVDAKTYEKDKIPTARPFSEVFKEGAAELKVDAVINVPKEESAAAIRELEIVDAAPKQVGAPSVETLLNGGGAKYQKYLEVVYGAESNEPMNFVPGKFRAKEALKVLTDQGKRSGLVASGKEIEIVAVEKNKFNKGEKRVWGQLQEGGWVALSYADGKRLNVENPSAKKKGVPAEVAALFNLTAEDLGNPAKMRKLRLGSSQQFEQEVNASSLLPAQKAELIEVFKVLDLSYGRVAKGNSPEREIALNKQVKGLTGGKRVEELFAEKIGFGMRWNVLYHDSSAEKLSANPNENKQDVEDILRGGEVFMLRVDQKTHGGKLEARIDQWEKGDPLAKNIDAPKTLRPKETYIYKYLEISDKKDKADILKKYLKKDSISLDEVANYKIAQTEIPLCENPAIAIKNIEAPKPVVKPEPVAKTEKIPISINLEKCFRDVPAGYSLLLRFPDALKYLLGSKTEFNHLVDPSILGEGGEVIRESEYVNAHKRLEAEPHKFIETRVNDVLPLLSSLEDYRVDTVLIDGQEVTNEKIITEMATEYRALFETTGKTETSDSFLERFDALNAWQKKWEEKGANERMFKLAETLQDFDCNDFEELSKKMQQERDAFYLAELLEGDTGKLAEQGFAEAGDPKLETILKRYGVSTSLPNKKVAIESALYDEDKINAVKPPYYAGDVIINSPTVTRDDKLKLPIWENQAEVGSELLNVHTIPSLTIQAVSLVSGYLIYLKTGIGRGPDLANHSARLETYLKEVDASEEAKNEFRAIFRDQTSFDKFRNFILKGQLPSTGGNVFNVSVREIQVAIPSWKLLKKLCGREGCEGAGKNVFVDDTHKPPPGNVVLD